MFGINSEVCVPAKWNDAILQKENMSHVGLICVVGMLSVTQR